MSDYYNFYNPTTTDSGLNFSMSDLSDLKYGVPDSTNPSQDTFGLGLTDDYFNQSQFQPDLTPATQDTSWTDLLFGTKDKNGKTSGGYAAAGLGLLKSGLGFYLGSKQLSQAEDALAENKRQFNLNYAAQKALTNDQLQWQYNARENRRAGSGGELVQI